ncbi:uncharacterized protein JCM10292_002153 [Rhodotorula paludigena]|uniref:uncharacterized protein n=1 Tax=Rhodotorula paludigena TaxID=86838 RepID=UPI00317B6563
MLRSLGTPRPAGVPERPRRSPRLCDEHVFDVSLAELVRRRKADEAQTAPVDENARLEERARRRELALLSSCNDFYARPDASVRSNVAAKPSAPLADATNSTVSSVSLRPPTPAATSSVCAAEMSAFLPFLPPPVVPFLSRPPSLPGHAFPPLDFDAVRRSTLSRKDRTSIKHEWRAARDRHKVETGEGKLAGVRKRAYAEVVLDDELGGCRPLKETLRVASTNWSGISRGSKALRASPREEDLFLTFDESAGALLGVTSDGRTLLARGERLPPDLVAALERFTAKANEPRYQSLSRKAQGRGAHRQITLGVTRDYSNGLHFTQAHRLYSGKVAELLSDQDLARLSGWMSRFVQAHFLRIHKRYEAARGLGSAFASPFGIFPMLCINLSGAKPVFCDPHTDGKNPAAGVCLVLAYGTFNSRSRFWLRIPELGVCLELPAGVPLAFPSALLQHHNWHVDGADDEDEARAGRGVPRGSLVWFAQSTWLMFRELGCTVEEAKVGGLRTRADEVDLFFRV